MKKSIVVLTGAGISQESGLSTFRDQNGLWENHRVEDVASPEGFLRDPELVHRFYNLRRAQASEVQPNAAHKALAQLEQHWRGNFLLITQNVDDLHERAGSINVKHLHGELKKVRCLHCNWAGHWDKDLGIETSCPACEQKKGMRPDIVWFGEIPYYLEEVFPWLETCKIFLSVGTSGHVYPAAGFVSITSPNTRRIEINKEKTMMSHAFAEHRLGLAGDCLPGLVTEILEMQ